MLFLCIATFFVPFFGGVSAFENSFTIIAGGREYKYFYPQIDYNLFGEKIFLALDKEIEKIVLDTAVYPVNAKISFEPESEQIFTIQEGKNGRMINGEKLKKEVQKALLIGKNRVIINGEIKKPEVSANDLKKQTFLRAEVVSDYSFSGDERKQNVLLATSFISGTVVEPNQQFSFNQVVGLRSEERGFLPAKVILDGHFTEGVGGGVCQVSTALYNCALKAGLTVTSVSGHSLKVSYALPSLDAMVSDYFSDLVFVNNTPLPIYIKGQADGSKLTFQIYGEKLKYYYEPVSVITEIIENKVIIKPKITGEERDVLGKNGIKSEGYLYVYSDNKLIETRKIRQDIYKAIDEIIYKNEQ